LNPAQTFTIDVYGMGWYQGLGGRLMQHVAGLQGTQQPAGPADPTTGMIACDWAPSYTLVTQTSWTSGICRSQLGARRDIGRRRLALGAVQVAGARATHPDL
jgi:hypothetical protein